MQLKTAVKNCLLSFFESSSFLLSPHPHFMNFHPTKSNFLKPCRPFAASLILGSALLSVGFNTLTLRAKADPISAPANAYPQEVVDAYMDGCLSSAQDVGLTAEQAQGYCGCTIQEIQNQYTYEEFLGVVQTMQQSGEFPPEMVEIVNSCGTQP
jgi:hypothetical protein